MGNRKRAKLGGRGKVIFKGRNVIGVLGKMFTNGENLGNFHSL